MKALLDGRSTRDREARLRLDSEVRDAELRRQVFEAERFEPLGRSAGTGENAHPWAEILHDLTGIRIEIGEPLPEHGARLLAAMGVEVVLAAGAPCTCPDCNPSGRSGRRPPGKTRADLTDEERRRMREAYFARPEPPRR